MAESSDAISAHEWELSKENVQPIKQGRKYENLTAALQSQTSCHSHNAAKLKEERSAFESELRAYEGDDPLDVWDRYIQWTEQNYSHFSKQSHFLELLESCINHFANSPLYANDERYIDVWIKMVKFYDHPSEIFQYMYTSGIGRTVSGFYEAWAAQLEEIGSYKKADHVFIQGIKKGAQPIHQLRRRHSEFQSRVVRKTMEDKDEDDDDDLVDDSSAPRVAMGILKGGKKGRAPVNRAANVRSGSSALGNSQATNTDSKSRGLFSIHVDKENSDTAFPGNVAQFTTAPQRKVVNMENEGRPGKWKKAKIKQKIGSVPSAPAAPKFDIFQDSNENQPPFTPREVISGTNPVLSTKKIKPVNYLEQIQKPVDDPKLKPMYCKDKIYRGTEEFTFEELRANEWLKHQIYKQQVRQQMESDMQMQLGLEKQKLAEKFEEEKQRLAQQMNNKMWKLTADHSQSDLSRNVHHTSLSHDVSNNTVRSLSFTGAADSHHLSATVQNDASQLYAHTHNVDNISQNTMPSHSNSPQNSILSHNSQLEHVHKAMPQQTIDNVHLSMNDSVHQSVNNPLHQSVSGNDHHSINDSVHHSVHDKVGDSVHHSLQQSTPGQDSLHTPSTLSMNSSAASGDSSRNNGFKASFKNTPRGRHNKCAPSPTINTAAAMHAIESMFNGTFVSIPENSMSNPNTQDLHSTTENPSGIVPKPSSFTPSVDEPIAANSKADAGFKIFGQTSSEKSDSSNSVPFLIHEDSVKMPPPILKLSKSTPFVIHQDDAEMLSQEKSNPAPFTIHEDMFVDEQPHPSQQRVIAPLQIHEDSPSSLNHAAKSTSGPHMIEDKTEIISQAQFADPSMSYYSDTVNPTNDLVGAMDNDMTFAPQCASTCRFAFQASSTPFNPMDHANLKTLPISAIKQEIFSFDKHVENNKSSGSILTHKIAEVTNDTQYNTENTSNQSQNTVNKTDPTAGDATMQHRKSYANLSPITEASDEDSKSSGTSSIDSLHTDSSAYGGPTSLHAKSTAPSLSTVKELSLEAAASSKENSYANLTPAPEHSMTEPAMNTQSMLIDTAGFTMPSGMEFLDGSLIEQKQFDAQNENFELKAVKPEQPEMVVDAHLSQVNSIQHLGNQHSAEVAMASQVVEPADLHKSIVDCNQTCHEIDVTNYQNVEDNMLFEDSIFIDPNDPFDEAQVEMFLARLDNPLKTHDNYVEVDEDLPKVVVGKTVQLDSVYSVEKRLGTGAYASAYLISQVASQKTVMKVQKPGWPWELYISNELKRRSAEINYEFDLMSSLMCFDKGYFYRNGSILCNNFVSGGSLLDVVNGHRLRQTSIDVTVCVVLTIELLRVVQGLHQCKIIHCDIKPDNVLVSIVLPESICQLDDAQNQYVRLIDFGRGIDMTMYPEGQSFTTEVTTPGFVCIEMKTRRPWNYQTDLYNMVGCIHTLLFGDYMKVYCEGNRWKTTTSLRRRLPGRQIFVELFDTMLNIPSCSDLPDLQHHIDQFKHFYRTQLTR